MNKTLIAAAVSTALMAPVAAQADVTLYGRIHNGIAFVDTDGADSTTDLNSGGSRFGIKASSDLGNGLTASAHYEFHKYAPSSDVARMTVHFWKHSCCYGWSFRWFRQHLSSVTSGTRLL